MLYSVNKYHESIERIRNEEFSNPTERLDRARTSLASTPFDESIVEKYPLERSSTFLFPLLTLYLVFQVVKLFADLERRGTSKNRGERERAVSDRLCRLFSRRTETELEKVTKSVAKFLSGERGWLVCFCKNPDGRWSARDRRCCWGGTARIWRAAASVSGATSRSVNSSVTRITRSRRNRRQLPVPWQCVPVVWRLSAWPWFYRGCWSAVKHASLKLTHLWGGGDGCVNLWENGSHPKDHRKEKSKRIFSRSFEHGKFEKESISSSSIRDIFLLFPRGRGFENGYSSWN